MNLQKAQTAIAAIGNRTYDSNIDARARLIVTLLYLVAVLSVPMSRPETLLWLGIYPIITAEACGAGYARVLKRSMVVLPFIALVGIFNPLLQTQTAFSVGPVQINEGWVTFLSLLVRGLFAVQATIILLYTSGYYGFCNALRRFRCPNALVTQLLMLYRYLAVLLDEAMEMDRARRARGYGRKHYPLRMYGTFIGQLMVRTIERGRRIHAAMMARGFDGSIPLTDSQANFNSQSIVYVLLWTAALAVLRFCELSTLFVIYS